MTETSDQLERDIRVALRELDRPEVSVVELVARIRQRLYGAPRVWVVHRQDSSTLGSWFAATDTRDLPEGEDPPARGILVLEDEPAALSEPDDSMAPRPYQPPESETDATED